MAKTFNVISNIIRVSQYNGRIVFDHKIEAIFPGCRKVQVCTTSPIAGAIHVLPLYSYSGVADIHPERWRSLVDSAVICSDTILGFSITEEIRKQARQYAKEICDCPTVTEKSSYQREYTPVEGI
jgi:hypothetical protein